MAVSSHNAPSFPPMPAAPTALNRTNRRDAFIGLLAAASVIESTARDSMERTLSTLRARFATR